MIKSVFVLLVFLFLPKIVFGAGVVINEVTWAGTTEGWRYEWVELFNSGGAVDLTGWQIDNGASGNKTLVLSSGTIPASGYFLICRKEMTGCDLVETKMSLHNEYSSNGKLVLRDSSGGLIDSTPVTDSTTWSGGDNTTKQTMERTNTGWQTSANPNGTPRVTNSIAQAPEVPAVPLPTPQPPTNIPTTSTPSGSPLPRAEPEEEDCPWAEGENCSSGVSVQAPPPITYPINIYINEIMPSPQGADSEEEWIELYNQNGFEIDLANWQIKDTVGAVKTYTCPANTKISAYGFLLIPRPTSKITLQNSGDGLELLNPNQELVYSINYPKATIGQSYSRQGESWAWTTTPTPNTQNTITPPQTESKSVEVGPQRTDDSPENGSHTDLALANVSATVPNPINNLYVFLVAIIIAIISAIIVLFLKQKAND